MPSITLMVNHSAGLHGRPAALFVILAASFPSTIPLRNPARQNPPANVKGPLSVPTQAVNQGQQVLIEAEDESADAALNALKDLVESNFDEAAGR